MARLLLTGAGGFLGSALARRWLDAGHEVHAIVRPASRLDRLAAVRGRIILHVAAVPDDAARVFGEVRLDALVHAACAYGRAGETPRQVFDANLGLGIALLQAILDGGVHVDVLNTGSVLEPEVSLYALSKRQFSDWGARLATQSPRRLRFVDLRLQHMYGPGDDASKFTTHVLRSCARHEPVLALTAGEQRRDFLFIDDVVAAYDAVLACVAAFAPHETIDVGSGDAPTVREFVELAHRVSGSRTRLDFGAVPYRAHEAMLCRADTTRLRALGWRPAFGLESGLLETLRREGLA